MPGRRIRCPRGRLRAINATFIVAQATACLAACLVRLIHLLSHVRRITTGRVVAITASFIVALIVALIVGSIRPPLHSLLVRSLFRVKCGNVLLQVTSELEQISDTVRQLLHELR